MDRVRSCVVHPRVLFCLSGRRQVLTDVRNLLGYDVIAIGTVTLRDKPEHLNDTISNAEIKFLFCLTSRSTKYLLTHLFRVTPALCNNRLLHNFTTRAAPW
jgi:hypothetical protein